MIVPQTSHAGASPTECIAIESVAAAAEAALRAISGSAVYSTTTDRATAWGDTPDLGSKVAPPDPWAGPASCDPADALAMFDSQRSFSVVV